MRPITPQPGHTEGEVTDALASGQFVFVDCFTIEPLVGFKMRYTTAQRRVSVVPVGEVMRANYEANQVLITGLKVKNQIGVEVDEQTINIDYTGANTYQNYMSWPQALLTGRLDGGSIRRDRYIAKDYGYDGRTDWLGGFPMFLGLVSTLNTVGRQSAQINVKSDLVLMNTQMPQFLFEATCKNTWGDSICGVNQDDWAVLTAIDDTPTRTRIPWAAVTADYNQGKIYIDNGDAVVRVRTISYVDADAIYLAYPLDFDPYDGQAFTAYPGCQRTMDEDFGCPKYHVNWQEKFKGFPFIPVAETAL